MPKRPADRPDKELITRAIQGDIEAFGELYDFYLNAIYTFIYFQVSDAHEAEDLTEIVFLKAFEKLPDFREHKKMSNFRAWIYRIARNLVIDHYRTRKPTLNLDPDLPIASSDPHLEQQLQVNDDVRNVLQAMARLDGLQREVLILRLLNELTYTETAQALDITQNYVRVLQFRALKNVRTILKNQQNG